ncbi:ABC transporter ATP-binding protein [Natrialba swarupiae]|uniref:Cobalamin import ATP-binding protein BtuD n=1 Tax=Natrialba swarupiae TaxID=2448032 RepID=A0A5D5AI26_9EURY|nr:ABC transporter ATP-binding protein [Natrialba swarupiae]TYT60774.1 ABC transporter ATP-binding protein [Natrialba swarupiae]
MTELTHPDRQERESNAPDGNEPSLEGRPALRGENLVLGYGDEPIVDGESLEIPAGEITAIVGPNGSAKSTLLRALARQLEPDAGTVVLDGRDVTEFGDKAFARTLGLLSQESVSPDSVTVEELIYHGRYPHRGFFEPVGDDDRAAVERAIELAGVEDLRDREVGALSGGQRQLAWIAMALAQETDVLLLDEPTTFLDLRHQLMVMDVVERLNEESKTTIVLVVHDIGQAARHAKHVIALQEGTVYARGPPAEVLTEELLADVFGVEATVETVDGQLRVLADRPL